MKNIFLIIAMVLSIAYTSSAQTSPQYTKGFMEDTLNNSETAYLYMDDAASAIASTNLRGYGTLEVVMVWDSLSGTTTGGSTGTGNLVTLQYCYDEACTYTYDAATLVMNGNTQVVSRTEDTEFTPVKFKIKEVSAGTQTGRVRVWYYFKRKT